MVLTFSGGFYLTIAYGKPSTPPEVTGTCLEGDGTRGATPKGGASNTAFARAIASTGLEKKLQELYPKLNRRESGSGSDGGNNPGYELGLAIVFSGPVTVTSMKHHVEYAQGMMDYVFDWAPGGGFPVDNPPLANAMKVVPYTYDIALTRSNRWRQPADYGTDKYYFP